jgi:hypothetical protein
MTLEILLLPSRISRPISIKIIGQKWISDCQIVQGRISKLLNNNKNPKMIKKMGQKNV